MSVGQSRTIAERVEHLEGIVTVISVTVFVLGVVMLLAVAAVVLL